MQSKMKLGAVSLFVLGAACNSGGANMPEVGSEGPPNTGKIGVSIHEHLQNGANITSLNWTITAAGEDVTGTLNIGIATGASFEQGGLIAETGYTVSLTGTDDQGGSCSGSTSGITVTAEQVTQTTVNVLCQVNDQDGSEYQGDASTGALQANIDITGTSQAAWVCPVLTNITVADTYLPSGGLTGASEASSTGSGGTQTLLWSLDTASSTGGATITGPTTASPTINCNTYEGPATVTFYTGLDATLLDGGMQQECPSVPANTQSVTLDCDYATIPPIEVCSGTIEGFTTVVVQNGTSVILGSGWNGIAITYTIWPQVNATPPEVVLTTSPGSPIAPADGGASGSTYSLVTLGCTTAVATGANDQCDPTAYVYGTNAGGGGPQNAVHFGYNGSAASPSTSRDQLEVIATASSGATQTVYLPCSP
jgi:hypothetical protein